MRNFTRAVNASRLQRWRSARPNLRMLFLIRIFPFRFCDSRHLLNFRSGYLRNTLLLLQVLDLPPQQGIAKMLEAKVRRSSRSAQTMVRGEAVAPCLCVLWLVLRTSVSGFFGMPYFSFHASLSSQKQVNVESYVRKGFKIISNPGLYIVHFCSSVGSWVLQGWPKPDV